MLTLVNSYLAHSIHDINYIIMVNDHIVLTAGVLLTSVKL